MKILITKQNQHLLELQLKPSEMSTIESHSQMMYIGRLKIQIQRIMRSSYTTYFSSFSSFEILHLLIKSFVIPTLNRVYSLLKYHFLKIDLKNLKLDCSTNCMKIK